MIYRVGADEVGYGSWAGCVAVGCVAWPIGKRIEGLKDSKKYLGKNAHQKRVFVANEISRDPNVHYTVVALDVPDINQMGVYRALIEAFRRGLHEILSLPLQFEEVVLDGCLPDMRETHRHVPLRSVARADDLYQEVSAASVIAKVTRDSHMIDMDQHYPGYGFASHKGYGSDAHKQAILKMGPCVLHRSRAVAAVVAERKYTLAGARVVG